MSKSFYSRPDIYDITYSEKIEEVLSKYYSTIFDGKEIKTIFDCSFGTGNLSFVLSKMGYELSGSDISNDMLDTAKEKMNSKGLEIDLTQCDFRELSSKIHKTFDCVLSTGNSLAHVNNMDVKKTLSEMSKLVKKNGYIHIDTRNWDRILNMKQRFYYYNPAFKGDERINLMQVWDYNPDETMTFNILYSFEKDNRIIRREEFTEIYYPLKKELIVETLKSLGFHDFQINSFAIINDMKFEDMEWYSIIAQKG
ncbi:class I SAM-dependent methyltransferase [Oceanirhabdus seepicola]|uniref:Class I SAM-dependent methyltransferase n=1 Tax=Oceanirhabdus seepicola TaxID=2828781 RepID=A0A9J6NXK7_9CLOT|nr:class I SAM-dependent methyltransferase [Oceanirhabdus seepicola]MCM1988995.1 class I SAM-dependent methyltransferase [Oceanirhabdus seepicola]